jgi:hypothetical protein
VQNGRHRDLLAAAQDADFDGLVNARAVRREPLVLHGIAEAIVGIDDFAIGVRVH